MEALKNARLAPAPPHLLKTFTEVVLADTAFRSDPHVGCVLTGLPGYEITGPYGKVTAVPAVVARRFGIGRGYLCWLGTLKDLDNELFTREGVSSTPISVLVVPQNAVISPTK